jgi:PEP-CTERM motif
MKSLIAVLALALMAGVASADSTWTYQGNLMDGSAYDGFGAGYACGCELSGTVTLSGLTATSWSFTDGTHTLNQADSVIILNPYTWGTEFLGWTLDVSGEGIDFVSRKLIDPSYYEDSVYVDGQFYGHNAEDAGTWTDPVATPEPATLSLLGLGLAALSLKRGKKHQHHLEC